MTAEQPTILATSGGFKQGNRTEFEFGNLINFAIELSGVNGRRPKLCHIGTASGDQRWFNGLFDEAGQLAGVELTHLNLFPMPPTDDIEGLLLDADVVWVGGGSVANLLAVWRVHELDSLLHKAWRAGVVLGGVSAGSICWHLGGTTDSFGPQLRVVTDGLGFLPYGNGVHYDSEPARRPAIQAAVAAGTLPDTYCTDDGAGLLYRDTEFVEAVSERTTGGAYLVRRDAASTAVEHQLDIRRL
ncbi:MAG: peptidase E [Sciscionella sp.]|nr:peptidase E [Sciscionella sp.]